MLSLVFCSVLAAAPAKAADAVPALSKDVTLDGVLTDLQPALSVKVPASAQGPSASLGTFRVAYRKDVLYVGLSVRDDQLRAEDHLDLTVFFPESGTTAKGVVIRLGKDGLAKEAHPELGPPDWAQALLKAATKVDPKGFSVELAIPARALPRFQASGPLQLSLCADYADVDEGGAEPALITTCASGEMVGGPVKLPDDFRKGLKLTPSADVEGLEAREHGWVGFSKLHYPTWAQGDVAFTPESLAELVLGDEAVDPTSMALPLPSQLTLPDNRPLFAMLTGKNPYRKKDGCIDGAELRLALYLVKGTQATRVLEWPAANCRLGRAMRFELSTEGELSIGYTSGSTAHFTWSAEKFERSELGLAR